MVIAIAQLPVQRVLPIPLTMVQTPLILKKNQAMIIEASAANMDQSQKKMKIESAPYLTPSSSEFSPLCSLKTLSKQAFCPKDGPIFGPPFPLSVSQILPSKTPTFWPLPWMSPCSYTGLPNSRTSPSFSGTATPRALRRSLSSFRHNCQGRPTQSTFISFSFKTL